LERDIGRRFDILIIRLLLHGSVGGMEWFGIAIKKNSLVVKSKYSVKLLQTEPKGNNPLKRLTLWKKPVLRISAG